MVQVEVVVFDLKSAISAALCGANRLELCDNHIEGGTTPSFGTVSTVIDKLDIPIFPMIRPRGGDFLYDDDEICVMKRDIESFKSLGCQGVVLGVLKRDGTVDIAALNELVNAAHPMTVTFHRAFDRVKDYEKSLNQIYEAGCARVLTSGGRPTVREGLGQLSLICSIAKGKVGIIAGGGVDHNVVNDLLSLGIEGIHTPAKRLASSNMQFMNVEMNEVLEHISIDTVELKRILDLVKSHNLIDS